MDNACHLGCNDIARRLLTALVKALSTLSAGAAYVAGHAVAVAAIAVWYVSSARKRRECDHNKLIVRQGMLVLSILIKAALYLARLFRFNGQQ